VALAEALRTASPPLCEAARAGAELPPELVFAAFPFAIDPAWTRGHSFTVVQQFVDPPALAVAITARDGERVAVRPGASTERADAIVTMTRATFAALLRGEPLAGARPVVRGNRAAVAALRVWTERAQGRGG
jgi:hypothetical protein